MHHTLPLTLFLLAANATVAADWPHWRGPDRTGISQEKNWRSDWGATPPRTLWSAEVGVGFATVSVADGRVVTTGNSDDRDTVFCFAAATGKVLWKHSYAADLGDKYFEGGSTGTPSFDGGRVYHLSRWGDALCLDAATGKVIWSKNVKEETEANVPDWGFSGSPLILGDLVILNVGQGGLALKKASGDIVWKSGNKAAGYSTPLPFEQGGKALLAMSSGRAYYAVDPKTGAPAWEIPWRTSYGVNAADPIVSDGHIFISAGYNKGAALLKLGGAEPAKVWENKEMRNQMNPSVLVDGHLYGIDGNSDGGPSLKCLEWKTGSPKWSEKSVGSGSVTVAGEKLIVLSEGGDLIVAKPDPGGFKPEAKAKVLSGRCWTVPVLANGLIYCRNAAGKLVCVDVRK